MMVFVQPSAQHVVVTRRFRLVGPPPLNWRRFDQYLRLFSRRRRRRRFTPRARNNVCMCVRITTTNERPAADRRRVSPVAVNDVNRAKPFLYAVSPPTNGALVPGRDFDRLLIRPSLGRHVHNRTCTYTCCHISSRRRLRENRGSLVVVVVVITVSNHIRFTNRKIIIKRYRFRRRDC